MTNITSLKKSKIILFKNNLLCLMNHFIIDEFIIANSLLISGGIKRF